MSVFDQLGLDPDTAQAVQQVHDRVVAEYEGRLRGMAVDAAVKQAVTAAGGRNLTAIRALLDESALGDDPEQAAAAVAAVKRENPYLFAAPQVTAPGTGTGNRGEYTMQELGKLPLAEYRRYRGR